MPTYQHIPLGTGKSGRKQDYRLAFIGRGEMAAGPCHSACPRQKWLSPGSGLLSVYNFVLACAHVEAEG